MNRLVLAATAITRIIGVMALGLGLLVLYSSYDFWNGLPDCTGQELWHDHFGNLTCSIRYNAEEQSLRSIATAVVLVILIWAFVILGLLAVKGAASATFAGRRGAIKGTTMAWRAALAFAGRRRAELKKVSPLRNIIIAVLALLWIAANAAHAYIFFHGSVSNPYVQCTNAKSAEICDELLYARCTKRGVKYDEDICDKFSKSRHRFEHDRLGVTLKGTLNATGLAFVACFLIIGARRVSAALKFGREGARNG